MSAIELYQHKDFGGAVLRSDRDATSVNKWNDIITSVVVNEGQWFLYEHVNYGGKRWVVNPGRYPSSDAAGIENDKVSSFRRNWFWADPAFEAAWKELDERRAQIEQRLAQLDPRLAEARQRDASAGIGPLRASVESKEAELARIQRALAEAGSNEAGLKARRERAARRLDALAADHARLANLADAATTRGRQERAKLRAARLVLAQEKAARMAAEVVLNEQVRAREAALATARNSERLADERARQLREMTETASRETARLVDEAREKAAAERKRALDAAERAFEGDTDAALDAARQAAEAENAAALARLEREAGEQTRTATASALRLEEARRTAEIQRVLDDLGAPASAIDDRLVTAGSEVGALVDVAPTLSGFAIEDSDGRGTRVALVALRAEDGATGPGRVVRLVDEHDRQLDQSATDEHGLAVLRFPSKARGPGARIGVVSVPNADGSHERVGFKIAEGSQHAVVDVVVSSLAPQTRPTGDAFARLPPDITPSLFDDVTRLAAPRGLDAGGSEAKPSGRSPVIRRMVVPRVGPPRDGLPARRYLVTLRQEWIFVGQTTGELQAIEGLSPGEALREATTLLEDVAETVSDTVSSQARRALQEAQETMSQASSATSLVEQAASAVSETNASTTTSVKSTSVAAQVGIPLLFSVGVAHNNTRTSVNTRVRQALNSNSMAHSVSDASQQANSMMRAAQSELNSAMQRTMSTARSLRSRIDRSLDRVSPLLSRATNIMRWTLYENYLVCSRVEDVKEIVSERVAGVPSRTGQLFAPADVLEYLRIFGSQMLDPMQLLHVPALREAVHNGKDASANPLVVHVNRNRTHYFGLLLQAALDEPALRDDAPQLRSFPGHHPVWRLPIMGFDGDRAVIVRDVRVSDAYARQLLHDAGAATLVQIASPGAFAEAIQGLRELADLKGRVPPQLQPVVRIVPGDAKILDLSSLPGGPAAPADDPAGPAPLPDGAPDLPAVDAPSAPVSPPMP